ncbi:uncharacterized protein LOC128226572 [Mya arenaria]|nr:uncharacterized protein LOC128226572 [Mya arenaria]
MSQLDKGQPTCLIHPDVTSQVLCRDHQALLCVQCYLDGHKTCDIIDVHDVKRMGSRYGRLACELIVMKERVSAAEAAREGMFLRAEQERERLETQMSTVLQRLQGKLDEMKAASRQEMQRQLNDRLKVAKRTKQRLEGLTERLREGDGQIDSEGRLSRGGSGDDTPHVRFVLSKHLQDVLGSKDRPFGDFHVHLLASRKHPDVQKTSSPSPRRTYSRQYSQK